jgi:hypothetical protein
VFASIVSFVAGLLFWNKGEALARGKMSDTGFVTYKLTGAGAIFVVVLFLFYLINPLKPLSDYKKILIVYGNASTQESNVANPIPYKLTPSDIERNSMGLNPNDVAIEMIPFEFIYPIFPRFGDNNTYETNKNIPPGAYRVVLTQIGTNTTKTYLLKVPK